MSVIYLMVVVAVTFVELAVDVFLYSFVTNNTVTLVLIGIIELIIIAISVAYTALYINDKNNERKDNDDDKKS